jgi:hypothetical protein
LFRANQTTGLALAPVLKARPATVDAKLFWLVDLKTRVPGHLNCNPSYWIAANYARRSGAILENYGWLYLAYMNLKPRAQSACTFTEPADMESCLQSEATNGDRPEVDLMLTERVPTTAVASVYGLHPMSVTYPSTGSDFRFFVKDPAVSNERSKLPAASH